MGRDLGASIRAWRSFAGLGPGPRLFLTGRLMNAPLGPLDAELRRLEGEVLSVGAGHGLIERYLAELRPEVRVTGLELDTARVAAAQATSARSPRVAVREGDVRDLADAGGYDAVLAIDLLHHVRRDDQPGVLASFARALRPGGTLLVKDIATEPRWKHRVNVVHDRLVAGPEPIACRTPEEMADLVSAAGLEVERCERVDRLSPYPHYLVRARLPSNAASAPAAASIMRNGSSGVR